MSARGIQRPRSRRGGASIAALWTAALLFATGCGGPAREAANDDDYVRNLVQHREDRVERLRSSWLTVAGLYWLQEGDNSFGSGPENEIVFPAGSCPEIAGNLRYRNGEVLLQPAADSGLTIAGAPATERTVTAGEEAERMQLGRLTFFVIERSGRHAIRLIDPQFRALEEFHGIDFFEIDPGYAVEATLQRFERPQARMVETVIGLDAEMTAVGRVEFTLHGASHSLEALAGSGDELFIIFKDGTTGRETYDAGRYLYAPVNGDRVSLDFNRAYNPPCAFTPFATCPLPPPGNTIDARIEAGEKSYHAK